MSDGAGRFLYAEFTALPGHEDVVAELLRSLTDDVRRELGNVRFVPFRKRDDPATFFVFEEYRDEAAFQEHMGSEYGARFNAALGEHIAGDGSELTWLVEA